MFNNLKDDLNSLTMRELKEIGEVYSLSCMSYLKKKELVDTIYSALTNKNKLIDFIERLVDREFKLLKDVMNGKIIKYYKLIDSNEPAIFINSSIMSINIYDDSLYIYDEILEVLNEINLNKFKKTIEKNSKVYYLLNSMIELYGVVTSSDLYNAYDNYYGLETNEDDVPFGPFYNTYRKDAIDKIFGNNSMIYVHKLLTNNYLNEKVYDILNRQQSIDRKPISFDELLKYSNSNYYEDTKQIRELKKYLKSKDIDNDLIDYIITNIISLYRIGPELITPSIEMIQDLEIELTMEDVKELLGYLNEVYNNTRVWSNNGWTPIEMRNNYK